MKQIVFFAAAMALAAPAAAQQAQPAPMNLEQAMLLRCSAVFAVVAGEQDRGEPGALAYPPLRERGREFFVRASARLMDERGWSREEMEAALRAEATQFQADLSRAPDRDRFIGNVMQPCLSALEAAGL
ncbi:MAG TPA: hypothetical protein VNR60_05080 [Croceibacterium sp.]|nr:hypothetical protein [Croceibacterium sp.]